MPTTMVHVRVDEKTKQRAAKTLAGMGYKSICLYGVGHEARVLELLAREAGIEISAVASWDGYIEDRATRTPPRPEESLAGGNEIVLVADMVNIDPKIARLVKLGVARERIWVLH